MVIVGILMVLFLPEVYGAHGAENVNHIIHMAPGCPSNINDSPSLTLTADVPAKAVAKCKNGDKPLVPVTTDEVKHVLLGTFDSEYSGPLCQFYKKTSADTFVVDVEVGWGEEQKYIVHNQRIFQMSCAYDAHGNGISAQQPVGEGLLAPNERQELMGDNSTATFALEIIDVLDHVIETPEIAIGRKVRLRAKDATETTGAFRAISCWVENAQVRYAILRAGCGDGLVFDKEEGFQTDGDIVLSPYFEAFKLIGDNTLQFDCTFTVCNSSCNGDSCESAKRRKRSTEGEDSEEDLEAIVDAVEHAVITATSRKMKTVIPTPYVDDLVLPDSYEVTTDKTPTEDNLPIVIDSLPVFVEITHNPSPNQPDQPNQTIKPNKTIKPNQTINPNHGLIVGLAIASFLLIVLIFATVYLGIRHDVGKTMRV